MTKIVSYTDSNRTELKKYILLSILLMIILCTCQFYALSMSRRIARKTVVEHFIKPILPSEPLCHVRGNGVFIRDRLRKLAVNKVDNRSAYVNISDSLKEPTISGNYTNLTQFIANCHEAFMSRRLQPLSRSIPTIFHDPPHHDMVRPSCDGLWMEFGVFHGGTLSAIANWKASYCGNTSQPVYGFDSFSGLPTDWRPGFARGVFYIPKGTVLQVPFNTVLVKGLFIDTLPIHLRLMDHQYRCHTPVSFIHIDCDIYDGARDVLFLLGSRFVPGTIIVFDELFNYPAFEKHEIKALYEFLSGSNLQLVPLGSSSDIDLNPTNDKQIQSFGFVTALRESS